jgi:hypothetical protein
MALPKTIGSTVYAQYYKLNFLSLFFFPLKKKKKETDKMKIYKFEEVVQIIYMEINI